MLGEVAVDLVDSAAVQADLADHVVEVLVEDFAADMAVATVAIVAVMDTVAMAEATVMDMVALVLDSASVWVTV